MDYPPIYVKARYASDRVTSALADSVDQARKLAADLRDRYDEVWMEDAQGRRLDEAKL